MRILYIAHTTDWHGSSIALFNLIMTFLNRHEIHVLLPKKDGVLYDKLWQSGATIHTFDYRMHVINKKASLRRRIIQGITTISINRKAKKKFKKLIEEISPDIVHCNVGPISFSAEICAKKQIPHIWHIREYQDKDFGLNFIPSKKAFIKKVSDKNNVAIAITKDIFKYWTLNPNKDKVIYDGVFSQTTELHEFVRKNQFIFVGRVDKAKGTLEVIEAFREIANENPDLQLIIAGQYMPDKNDYAKKCQDYVKENSLDGRILFLGERNDIYDLIASSKALIVASRSEGFGFITVEGMLNKTIVIGKNSGGTKEQFDNGIEWTGKEIGIRYKTKEDLVQAMRICLTNPYDELRQRAFHVVWNNYSIQKHSAEIEQVYLEKMKSHKNA